jgi:hypothetical protein
MPHAGVSCRAVERGRLIRVRKFRGDTKTVAYIVALTDPGAAVLLIKAKAADPDDAVEDIGQVSEALLSDLNLKPGEFARTDNIRRERRGG